LVPLDWLALVGGLAAFVVALALIGKGDPALAAWISR
jgi:membrane protein required for beta-lactamase induction